MGSNHGDGGYNRADGGASATDGLFFTMSADSGHFLGTGIKQTVYRGRSARGRVWT